MSALWYVSRSDGDVEPLTLDELDAAFQAGHVNANTMVLAAGATQWARLGELAGLDQPPPPARPVMPYYSPSSLRPVSVDLSEVGYDDTPFKPKKSKKWLFGTVLVAGALGAAAFGAQREGITSARQLVTVVTNVSKVAASHISAFSQTSAPAAAPAPAPAPQPAAAPAPQPVVAAPVAPVPVAPAPPVAPAAANPLTDPAASRLTQEQKEKLAAADKAREVKAKVAAKSRASAVTFHSSSRPGKVQGFTTNGNKYDPLNATIP
jgi:hypothetical protein